MSYRKAAMRGNRKQCGRCTKFKPLSDFAHGRGQCNQCRKELTAEYRRRGKNKPHRLTNAYSCQSVLLMSDWLPCPKCGQPVMRRELNTHAKLHRR